VKPAEKCTTITWSSRAFEVSAQYELISIIRHIDINSWFVSNMLYLNIDKTQFIQFLTKNCKLTDLSVSYENKHSIKVQKVKILGLTIDNYVMEFPYRRNNTQMK
jgi:hypothetical protein